MAFAKKLFFITLFISILMEAGTTSADPWANIAWYFQADLKSWLPASGIALTPIEIAILLIVVIWAMRGPRKRRFHFERGLLFWPMIGLLGLLVYGLFWGVLQHGSNLTVGLWEIRALLLGVLAYFLVGILFTHRRDLDTLTWVILISTGLLGIECIIRYFFFIPGHQVGDLDYDHEDATLLGFVVLLSVAMILLGGTKRQKYVALASILLDSVALALTHRRTGFAGLAVGMVFLAVILFRTNRPLFMKIVPVTALLMTIYLGAEWNCSYGTLCQPARALTSQINPDPRDLSSNEYRLMERQDLIINIQSSPLTGRGFGNTFIFYIPLPNLSFWAFWQYTPHNEILWIWVKAGMFGFMVFWWLIGSSIYRSGRLIQALNAAGDDNARALLASAACLIVMQVTISYVDLGLTTDRAMLLIGVMLGVIGHLPGILRRTTNIDTAGPQKEPVTTFLDTEMPEVQVGLLAHALVQSAEKPTSARSTRSRPRPYARRTEGSQWGQTSHWGQASHWGQDEQSPQRARPAPSFVDVERAPAGRTATQRPPEEDGLEEFPWVR